MEWPTQVTVASVRFALTAAPSFSTLGRSADRGWKVVAQMREKKNLVRTHAPGGA